MPDRLITISNFCFRVECIVETISSVSVIQWLIIAKTI